MNAYRRVGGRFALLAALALTTLSLNTSCIYGKATSYRVELIPQAGMNDGSPDPIQIDTIWTTPSNESKYQTMSSLDWFQSKSTDLLPLVNTGHVDPRDPAGATVIMGGDPGTIGVPETITEEYTGMVLFANYRNTAGGRLVVPAPSVWFGGTATVKVFLQDKQIASQAAGIPAPEPQPEPAKTE